MESRSPELSGYAKLSGMEGYVAKTYGERIASVYDQRYPSAVPGQVDLLAELAGAGPALFTEGFQTRYLAPIVIGIVLTVLLALAMDLLLVGLRRAATPWTRA